MRIDEIRAREQAATPGKWYLHDLLLNGAWFVRHEHDYPICEQCTREDADFMANARQDIPYLISEVDRLTAELEQYRKQKPCEHCINGLDDVVCYLSLDNGNAQDIPLNRCPNCGRTIL